MACGYLRALWAPGRDMRILSEMLMERFAENSGSPEEGHHTKRDTVWAELAMQGEAGRAGGRAGVLEKGMVAKNVLV